MVTPDFEEWLMRQDIPVRETTTIERYQRYLAETFGVHGASLDVAANVWQERYNILPQLGIHVTTRHYTVRGEPFTETRYGITGYRGLWGTTEMYRIALEKAEAEQDTFATQWLMEKRRVE